MCLYLNILFAICNQKEYIGLPFKNLCKFYHYIKKIYNLKYSFVYDIKYSIIYTKILHY